MTLDIAMGGSTNTVLHLLAIAYEAGVPFSMQDIDRLSRKVPNICKVAPSSHLPRRGREPRRWDLHHSRSARPRRSVHREAATVHAPTMGDAIDANDIRRSSAANEARVRALAAREAFERPWHSHRKGTTRNQTPTPRAGASARSSMRTARRRSRGTARQPGRGWCASQDGRRRRVDLEVQGPARIFHSPGRGMPGHPRGSHQTGDVLVIRYEGPKGDPHAGDALPDVVSQVEEPGQAVCADHRRALQRRDVGLSIGHVSPEAAEGGTIGLVEEATASASTFRRAASSCSSSRT